MSGRSNGLVASSFFDFFKVFLAILFSFTEFALLGIVLLDAKRSPKSTTR
jgi:hypothetical protein